MKITAIAVLVLAGPSAFAWWTTHGDAVVKAVVPIPTPSANAEQVVDTIATFPGCKALRVTYPHGVKRPGAKNTGRRIRGGVAADAPVYRVNKALDLDHDGLTCELPRKN